MSDILQREKQRLRRAKSQALCHTAGVQQHQNLNPARSLWCAFKGSSAKRQLLPSHLLKLVLVPGPSTLNSGDN